MPLTDPEDAKSRDQFGRPISLNVKIKADLASHYDYSPGRFRLFVNGVRQFVQYGNVTEFTDSTSKYELTPQSSGDVVTFETNEKFRYGVQHVLQWSAAMQASQALSPGDAVTLGYGDADMANSSDDTPGPSADGWFFLWDSGLDTDEVRIAQYRNGTEQSAKVVPVEQALTDWTRWACELSWYGIGASEFHETYTQSGVQRNPVIGRLSADDGVGPQSGNKPVQASVKAGSADTAGSLTLEMGSVGVRNFGDTTPIIRQKTHAWTGSIDATGEWVALDAMRVDPDRHIVNTQLVGTNVMEYSASDDVHVVAMSFDQSKLADSAGNAIVDGDFSTPPVRNAQNTVIETTTAVDQFPDSSGTVQTDGQAADPGGYQIGYGSLYTSGQGAGEITERQGVQSTQFVSDRDIVVFLGKSGTVGDVTVEVSTDEQW